MAWIRTLGCVVCARVSGGATVIEAAHTNALGSRGMGQKTTDFSAIPLCSGHHREYPDSYHRLGEPDFVRQHRIDVQHVATELKHSFDRHFAGLPGSEFSEKLLFRTARDAAENGAARHPKEKTWDNRG